MDITVFNVDVIPGEEQAHLAFTTQAEGAETLTLHVVPIETFENTAAEYGIDPDDFDTLLDVVLYQPYLPPDAITPDHPQFLYNADTVDEAREHLLARVAEVKGPGTVVSVAGDSPEQGVAPHVDRLARSGEGCPVTFVKQCAPIDRRVIAEKRTLVDKHRATRRLHRQQAATPTPAAAPAHAGFAASVEDRIARARARVQPRA